MIADNGQILVDELNAMIAAIILRIAGDIAVS